MSNGNSVEHIWIQLYGGDQFYLQRPTVEQIHASDIAHALSFQSRYLGHCKKFYSIAEHCCLMADYEWERAKDINMTLWALLHDATEAYMPDFPRPWKRLPQFEFVRAAEEDLMSVISERFDLDGYVVPDHVDALDRRILADEADQVFMTGPTEDWGKIWKPGLGVQIQFWTPEVADMNYLERLMGLIQLRIEAERRREEG